METYGKPQGNSRLTETLKCPQMGMDRARFERGRGQHHEASAGLKPPVEKKSRPTLRNPGEGQWKEKLGLTWADLKRAAQNRVWWRCVAAALCSSEASKE